MMGAFGFWGWLTLGLVLIGVEVVLFPGGFLLWIGVAAVLMAGLVTVFTLDTVAEVVLFSLLALGCCLLGWRIYRNRRGIDAAHGLGDRATSLLDRECDVVEAIENGYGRVQLDDTTWRVCGDDTAAGTRVRVVGVDGATLKVTPLR